jgi:hypothetical protein
VSLGDQFEHFVLGSKFTAKLVNTPHVFLANGGKDNGIGKTGSDVGTFIPKNVFHYKELALVSAGYNKKRKKCMKDKKRTT